MYTSNVWFMKEKYIRKYRKGTVFRHNKENMFWERIKIVDLVPGSIKVGKSKDIDFSYIVECTPFNTERFNKITMQVLESVLINTMEEMEQEREMEQQVEYRIEIVGEYSKKGIKVRITEKDKDSGVEFPHATISVWTQQTTVLKENEFVLKNYSENEGIDTVLLNNGIIELVGEEVLVGRALCPVVRLTEKDTYYI